MQSSSFTASTRSKPMRTWLKVLDKRKPARLVLHVPDHDHITERTTRGKDQAPGQDLKKTSRLTSPNTLQGRSNLTPRRRITLPFAGAVAGQAVAAAEAASPAEEEGMGDPLRHDILQRTTLPTPLKQALRVSTSLMITMLPVSLRLRASFPMWELINSDKWVLEVIKSGYKPRFRRPPPLTKHYK